jgi:large subunit ribosomal protein L29
LELNHSVSPIENPLKIRGSRRTIARMIAELRKREIESTKN